MINIVIGLKLAVASFPGLTLDSLKWTSLTFFPEFIPQSHGSHRPLVDINIYLPWYKKKTKKNHLGMFQLLGQYGLVKFSTAKVCFSIAVLSIQVWCCHTLLSRIIIIFNKNDQKRL